MSCGITVLARPAPVWLAQGRPVWALSLPEGMLKAEWLPRVAASNVHTIRSHSP